MPCLWNVTGYWKDVRRFWHTGMIFFLVFLEILSILFSSFFSFFYLCRPFSRHHRYCCFPWLCQVRRTKYFCLMVSSLAQGVHSRTAFPALLHQSAHSLISSRFTPTIAALGHWFKCNRAYAFGIAVSGSSIGGLCFPVILKHLIPLVGFRWTVRILALISFCCLMVSCLTIRTRLPLKGTISLTDAVDFNGFRDKDYMLAGIAAFLYVENIIFHYLSTV